MCVVDGGEDAAAFHMTWVTPTWKAHGTHVTHVSIDTHLALGAGEAKQCCGDGAQSDTHVQPRQEGALIGKEGLWFQPHHCAAWLLLGGSSTRAQQPHQEARVLISTAATTTAAKALDLQGQGMECVCVCYCVCHFMFCFVCCFVCYFVCVDGVGVAA